MLIQTRDEKHPNSLGGNFKFIGSAHLFLDTRGGGEMTGLMNTTIIFW